MELWQRLLVILIVVGLTLVLARLIDQRIMRANRSPEAMTRYRVLRRTLTAGIITDRRPLGPARDPAGAGGRRRAARLRPRSSA